MLRAFVVVEFCLDASVRPSLIELLPGQRTVSEYSSTEVRVRRMNLRRLRETVPGDEPAATPGSPDEHRNRTHQQNLPRPLIEWNSWSEVKAVEFRQPANDDIGTVSVILDVVYKLRVEHSCRAVLVFIHRQCVNKSKTST